MLSGKMSFLSTEFRILTPRCRVTNWACIASLIETCKLNDVEPQAYIADVLNRLVNLWPAARLDELMPWAWTKANAPDRLAA
jgi:IS66 C-terminal element